MVFLNETERLVRRRLLVARFEHERARRHIAAEADIDEIAFAFRLDNQERMDARRVHAGRHAPAYAGGRLLHLETKRAQHMAEQQVLLEAVSAASAFDELGVKRGRIELDRALEQRV